MENICGGIRRETIKLLPRLQELQISDCPKLRALPEGLQHATALKSFTVSNISLKEIKNLFYLEEVDVKFCRCLERVSNLLVLRHMHLIDSCSMLKCVEGLDTVQFLALAVEDDWIERLPQWLLGLIQEPRTNGGLQALNLYHKQELGEQFSKSGQYRSHLAEFQMFWLKALLKCLQCTIALKNCDIEVLIA